MLGASGTATIRDMTRRPHRLIANPISELCVKSDEAAVFPEYAFMSITSELFVIRAQSDGSLHSLMPPAEGRFGGPVLSQCAVTRV